MIECSDKNIWYKKRRKTGVKRCFSLLLILFIIIGIVYYYKCIVSELVVNLCAEYAYAYSTDAVNKAVIGVIDNSVTYDKLVKVDKNSSGDIILLSANSVEINKISREISILSENYLADKLEQGVPIPALAFTGIKMISGYGAKVNFKTLGVSSTTCEFDSSFTGVGINQTLHSIYVVIKSNVVINLPFNRQERECVSRVLICETVLVGAVPEIYLDGTILGK